MRVAFLTNIISPYRRPVFQELAATPGWDLRVFVNACNEFDRTWNVDCDGVDVVETRSLALKNRRVRTEPIRYEEVTTRYVPTGLWRDLRKFKPDVVISIELGPRSFVAANYCRKHKIPLVVWSYQSRSSMTAGGGMRRRVREFILRRCQAVIGMGIQSREILESYGIDPARVFDAPNSGDDQSLLTRLHSSASRANQSWLRKEIGKGRKIAVVPARFIPMKGISELLNVWEAVPESVRSDWVLAFVGRGPLAPCIDAKEDLGVRRLEEVPPGEVADLYAMADLHIFASLGDVWGLVVNEAMLCSTPTLCSIHAACCDDLIQEGVNGFTFDPVETTGAAAKLAEVLQRDDLAEIGAQAALDGAKYSTAQLAEDVRGAVRSAVANHSRAPVLA